MKSTISILLAFALLVCFSAGKGANVSQKKFSSEVLSSDSVKQIIAAAKKTQQQKKRRFATAKDSLEMERLSKIDSAFQADGPIKLDSARQIPEISEKNPLQPDSLSKDTAEKAALEAPVNYTAADSMVYDASQNKVFLYGKAQVKFQNMQLDAGKISMNMDSAVVHAVGLKDSIGKEIQRPVYQQGSDKYDSDAMDYNFKSRKGYITNVYTTQGDGFLMSAKAKRTADGTLYLEHAKYTTCNAKHPHFYLSLSRAKVNPGKETIFGPAYLVVEDVPLPLGIPYGFFPFNKKYSSGFIMPSYGEEYSRGFYLRNGGYYMALNDYMDLKLLGEIYTKGSWGVSAETNYKKRYKYNGNFYISYLRTVEGEKNLPDYSVSKSLKVQWSHSKAGVGEYGFNFSARVNYATENYEKTNLSSLYNPLAYTQSTRASSISFSKSFPGLGLNISGSTNLTQNMRDSTVAMTLPDLSFSLNRIYPFRKKHQVGKEKWYEKISLSYSGQFSNSISTKENKLFHTSFIKDWKNGLQHSIPIDANFQMFKYINISPSISFTDIMYSNRIMRSWDARRQVEKQDTVYGFYNLYSWRSSLSFNTTLYGFYKPWRKLFGDKIVAIRHVLKPNVSFSYSPDFTTPFYGYMRAYRKVDAQGNVSFVNYSPYSNGIYGYPSSQKQGMVSMSLSNNLEMKIRTKKDSTGMKKISLLDELSGSLSYNLAAKTRPWSDLSTRIRLKLTKSYTFSLAAVFATYAYMFNKQGQVVQSDRTEWSYGRFGRFQGMSQNFSYTFNNDSWKKILKLFTKDKSKEKVANKSRVVRGDKSNKEDANIDPDLKRSEQGGGESGNSKITKDGYLSFSLPWSFTVSYGITMFEDRNKPINRSNMRYPYSFTQSLNFSGYIRLSKGWNISYSSGYDFERHMISMTTASLSRDLHCFQMSCNVVLRPYASFNFNFSAKASELADALKWEKRSSYSSNIEWY